MKLTRILPLVLALILSGANLLWLDASVNAASLTTTSLRLNRMSTSTATSQRLIFKPATSGATSIALNMNGNDTTTWTSAGGLVAATQTVTTSTCVAENAGTTALAGTPAASGTGSTITITGITAMSNANTYCLDLSAANSVTTPTAAGEYHPTITVGSDSTSVAARVVTNDQILINATVPPTFNFVLSGNTDNFTTNLAPGTVATTTGVTATINTNAPAGWIAWAKGNGTGLSSVAASKVIPSTTPGTSATLSAGTEGYALGITNITQGTGAGTTVASTAYNAQAAAHGSGVDTTYRQIASSPGTASGAVLTIKERAAISALTPAASDYTDTVTLIGAGNF